MNVGDTVIRLAPCRPEPKRERTGMEQYACYQVAAVDRPGELIRVVGVGRWHPVRWLELVPEDPCA